MSQAGQIQQHSDFINICYLYSQIYGLTRITPGLFLHI